MAQKLSSWRVFWVLALVDSAAVLSAIPFTDVRTVAGSHFMVAHSVRCALPLLLLVFAASPLASLWPNTFTRWLRANRKYTGLAFAVGMAWQLVYIAWLWGIDPQAVRGRLGTPFGIAVSAGPYVLLLGMVLTSFQPIARLLSARNWRFLHKAGLYSLWFDATFTYAFYSTSMPFSKLYLYRVVVLSLLLSIWGLRIFDWSRKWLRRRNRASQSPEAARGAVAARTGAGVKALDAL